MFNRVFTVLPFVALVAVTAAMPTLLQARGDSTDQCNTGDTYCCNEVTSSNSTNATELIKKYSINLGSLADSLVGLSCSPVSVIGTGSGASCTSSPVCCTNNDFNGVINLGCSPVTASA